MEAPIGGGHTGGLPLSGQAARREWRKVSEMPNGQGRIGTDGPGNQSRAQQSGRLRSGNVGQRRSSQNGRMFHPGSGEHSSDSDLHGGDGGGGHLLGGPVSPHEIINQNIGQQEVLYEEMHRQQQKEHVSMNTMSMESALGAMNNPEDALEQQLLDISRKREQLQQAELELRAQFIARSEVHRMQSNYEEQSKQHAEIVASLQNEIHERDQRIHHLEQNLEEREQQLRANQMQANEAQVWAKDGLLREQTNELASLRRERDASVAEQKAALSQLEEERSDYTTQIEHLKEQLHEKERHRQEAEEQNRATQELLLFKDGQLQEAQAWMARAQELDAYHVNANQTLHAELRDRNDQLNQVWMGYQRQLADMERFHAQVVQRLQAELNETREHAQMLKGSGSERLGAKEERKIHSGNHIDFLQREGNEETGAKVPVANNAGVVRGNPIILSHGSMEANVPIYIPLDNSIKGDQATGHPVVPSPAVVGISPVMSSGIPVMHQYGLQQQPLTSMSQALPVLQTSIPQLHAQPHVLSTPHHPQQQVGRAQHLPSPQKQPQVTQTLHLGISSSSLPKPGMQPSQPQQLVLDHEEGQQHGGILLSQLSSKPQTPAASAQPIGQKAQQEATVTEPVQSSREGQKLPHSSHDQQQVELSLQHNRQSNALPERQRQEQLQHSLSPSQSMQEQQTKSFKQVPVQQHDETPQLQHQQGISSSMHHLSQPAAPVAEKNQLQQKPSLSKSIMAKQEPREPGANPVNLEQNVAESIKNPEPVLLDERALLACLVRAVPAEANAKISMKSTLPNRLGKMLAPLHWQSYRKQYGRLDEFVSSHKELFVIEGDYIYLREGAHAKVSATTAVAKAAAAAAAASPAGLDRPPVVAVTPVAQVAQLQRGKAAKAPNKDVRPQSQQDEPNILTQRSISPQQSKSGNIRQISASFVPRNSVGTVVAASNNEGKLDGIGNTSDGEFSSNNLPTGKNSDVTDNGEANGFGNSRVGNHGNRQQNSRNSYAGSGQYRKQDNHYRSQTQDGRPTPTPTQ
ncbi:uncharacterized protein [Physcomitrium patens]|uniref:DUF7725 domain-containing protein n=1 Tax=Physcomitrium patens TaxID=3218 RepID=A0A7I4F3K0_PHYPA|nr:neurofilament medium polypeptide-like isoform X3 [Physcomitrium patens]|eukprot:XP_024394790.1 neurofilament medium polypeptide-like isoform X3 [Physcomitrella patens]